MDAGHRVDQRAEGTGWSEDIDQLLLDEMDKSRQANVVFAQHIGQLHRERCWEACCVVSRAAVP
jgi:hypothetical protein